MLHGQTYAYEKKKMSSNKFFVIRLNHVSFFPIATGTVR